MSKATSTTWRPSGWARFTIGVLVLLLGLGVLAAVLWSPWLRVGASVTESNIDTLRSVGLLIGGVLALVFGIWRAWVAERQVAAAQGQLATAQGQLEAAQAQVTIAQQSSLNDTYQRSAEMLGSGVLAVRLGGIYALQSLAAEHRETYHIQVMRLLCAFVRNPTPTDDPWAGEGPKPFDIDRLREDVQAAMNVIGYRDESQLEIESQQGYHLDLSGASLTFLHLEQGDLRSAILEGVYLQNAHIPSCRLSGANLFQADLTKANLRFAHLNSSDLSGARLREAKMARAILDNANCYETVLTDAVLHGASLKQTDLRAAEVSAVDFSRDGQDPAEGLTQNELAGTRQNVVRPPLLLGVIDPSTGKPVVWNG